MKTSNGYANLTLCQQNHMLGDVCVSSALWFTSRGLLGDRVGVPPFRESGQRVLFINSVLAYVIMPRHLI